MDKKSSAIGNEIKLGSIKNHSKNIFSTKDDLIQSEESFNQMKTEINRNFSSSKKRKREPDTLPPSLMWIFNVQ